MVRKIAHFLVAGFALACLVLPASASTWRSTSGNIFRFYPDGSMTLYANGGEYYGNWWWISNNYQFGYSVAGNSHYVTMEGDGAVCQGPGPAQYWTLMSARGEKGEDEPVDTKSWFMAREATPSPKVK